jgi:hypothetical protein
VASEQQEEQKKLICTATPLSMAPAPIVFGIWIFHLLCRGLRNLMPEKVVYNTQCQIDSGRNTCGGKDRFHHGK